MADKTTLKQQAYDVIRTRILRGAYRPGELLNRRGLAAGLAMSVLPVHEALLQLERDGLLETQSRVGTRVKSPSAEDVRGHLILREALECQAARLFCGVPIVGAFERLAAMADAIDIQEPLSQDCAEHEVAFHIALVELADCPVLLREYRQAMRIEIFYRTNQIMRVLPRVPPDLHLRYLETLAAATPARAESTVRSHIWYGKPDVLRPSAARADADRRGFAARRGVGWPARR